MTAYSFISGVCNSDSMQQSMFDVYEERNEFDETTLIAAFIDFCKEQCKFNIIEWSPSRPGYPSFMFLGGDRGILAYINFSCIISNNTFHEKCLRANSIDVLETLKKAYSHLDRPVFFIYIISCEDVKGVFFETNEQIKDRWLKSGFSKRFYTPVFKEMGSVTNLFDIMNDLKKCSVHFS